MRPFYDSNHEASNPPAESQLPRQHETLLLTKTELAKKLKVSTRQVELMVKASKLPEPIRIGSHPRWLYSEICDWLNKLSRLG
mgnify:CR=1 FL=1|jgi:predicted DNA-binding transcriptional regulator AlpA